MARYREIARGQILGDKVSLLKLIFHQESRSLLGVHGIGRGAMELIHIGQAVFAVMVTLTSLSECYRIGMLPSGCPGWL